VIAVRQSRVSKLNNASEGGTSFLIDFLCCKFEELLTTAYSSLFSYSMLKTGVHAKVYARQLNNLDFQNCSERVQIVIKEPMRNRFGEKKYLVRNDPK
jgi:hypothetical protein